MSEQPVCAAAAVRRPDYAGDALLTRSARMSWEGSIGTGVRVREQWSTVRFSPWVPLTSCAHAVER
jgi:hypothetical protein